LRTARSGNEGSGEMLFLSPYGVDDLELNILIRDKIA